MEARTKIIEIIILLILIAGTIYFLFIGPGKDLLRNMGLISGITPQEQEESEHAFDVVIKNLENCAALSNTNCACDVFPSWPGTFAQNYRLSFNTVGKDTFIELIYGKKSYKNSTLKDIGIAARVLETGDTTPMLIKKELDWKDEPPLFVQEGYKNYRSASIKVYKGAQQGVLYLLITNLPKERLSELKPRITELKSCA
ncbi:MAG: hypothetical protein ACPLXC_01320 [Candidatus Pacearchaeota archaeon]